MTLLLLNGSARMNLLTLSFLLGLKCDSVELEISIYNNNVIEFGFDCVETYLKSLKV